MVGVNEINSTQTLHQFLVGAYQGDAIYNQAVILQKWLRDWGWISNIYAENIQPDLKKDVQFYTDYEPNPAGETVLLHYSIGSDLLSYLLDRNLQFILIYHNLTPPHFMKGFQTSHQQLLQRGVDLLPSFAEKTRLALADSEYNRQDLLQSGFQVGGVLPVPFDEEAYRQPPHPDILARYDDDYVNLLFVGRLVPNKRSEDVIKVFYYYRQINPRSRLFLVGMPLAKVLDPYQAWLKDLTHYLGLDDVYFPGYVSLRELLAYYHLADVYVSMSEHEGYGVPLVESMYFDVPVLAYRASAVPDTLGQSGLQVAHKDYPLIAELINQLVTCPALREGVIHQQRQRLAELSKDQVRNLFKTYIHQSLVNDAVSE